MHETILVGEISVTFLKSRHETGGKLDLFELTIPPQTQLYVPHIHRGYDEIAFGMDGVVTFTVEGTRTQVAHGDKLTIPRGKSHYFGNHQKNAARLMCLYTPGVMGPEYFREIAACFDEHGKPDLAEIGSVMLRYGVIPTSRGQQLT